MEFRLIDFHIYDEDAKTDSASSNSDDGYHTKKQKKDLRFIIQMFGINETGETVSIFIDDYQPFFYCKLPDHASSTYVKQLFEYIKSLSDMSYYKNDIISAKLVENYKLYGFTGGKKSKFAKFTFKNTVAMRKMKNLWYSYEDGERKLSPFRYNTAVLPLYESNIPPLLRYFHIQNISPSGWITISKSDVMIPLHQSTTCTYEYICSHVSLKSLPDKETRVPYKICSFDIEASSSHGDFPVPIKSYKRLASNIVDFFNKQKEISQSKDQYKKLLDICIMTAFTFSTTFKNDIDLVYPIGGYPGKVNLKTMIQRLNTLVIPLNLQQKDFELTIEDMFQQKYSETIEEINGGGEEEALGEENEEENKRPSTKKSQKKQTTSAPPAAVGVAAASTGIIDVLLGDLFRDEKIILLTNAFKTAGFPKLEGDKVTFIGSTFMRYGDSEPYLNHCIVLGTCADVEGAVIESVEEEVDVLNRWMQVIQRENPDIIIGYNIFGFDYEFMFRRAEENACVDEFLMLSRRIGELCANESNDQDGATKLNIEHTKVALASGEYDLRYFKMCGRIQIDMYSYFRRDFNLSSYKLDDVAGQFISDDISHIEYDTLQDGRQTTKLYSKNLMGLHIGDFIHIEITGFTSDYYQDGRKFVVLDIVRNIERIDKKGKSVTYNIIVVEGNHNLSDIGNKSIKWGMAKDDVTPQDIFRLTNEGPMERARVAKYCIQDCNLVHHLMNKIDVITGYVEMSRICSVPISYLVFRGQGIKLTSYVAKKCRDKHTLMPDLEKSRGNDGYEGAIVLPPKCKMYIDEPVACVDYSSLYPSSMISQNYSHDSKVWSREYNLQGNLVRETGERNSTGTFLYDNLPGYEYIDVEFDTYEYRRKSATSAAIKTKVGKMIVRWAQLPNGQKSIMPSILEELLKARSDTRKLAKTVTDPFMENILDKRQLGYKVTANSLYGQCGSKTSTFYEKDVAACTTATGRMMITYARKIVEEVYGDRLYETAALGPIKCHAEYVYGDSVANYTPVKVRIKGDEKVICTIEELGRIYGENKWVTCSEYGKQTKEFCELHGVESWSESGWTKIHRIIRHALASHKKMIRILTHRGLVDVTDDHSLIQSNGQEISPKNCQIGTNLLHATLPFDTNIIIDKEFYEISEYGTFISDDQLYLAKIATLIDQNKFHIEYHHNNGMISVHNNKSKHYQYDYVKTQIIEMHEIPYEGFVYDLTTENHHFAAGVGNLIVHNTDSVFFTFNLEDPATKEKIRGKPALEATIEIAQDVAQLCSQFLKPPMSLAYEKTLMPFILLSKKRYVGMLYEEDPNKGKLKFMGLSLKRRDACDYLKDTYGGILNILMDAATSSNTIHHATEFLKNSLQNLIDGKVSMDKLAITKSLRSDYKNPQSIAHRVLADRIGHRDPGNKPKPGDRIKYLFITNPDKKALLGERVETPEFIIGNKKEIDNMYYITNQLMKPLQQLFGLAVDQILEQDLSKNKGTLAQYKKDIDAMKVETTTIDGEWDIETYMKKKEKYCSAKIKTLLFEGFLQKINNKTNKIRSIDDMFKKK